MNTKRIVTNILVGELEPSRAFYVDFLNLEVAMERDEIITFAATNIIAAQISVVRPDDSGAPHPGISVEVSDVDEMYNRAIALDIEIVYPLTDEVWGVRRFFVADPYGAIVNILSHL